MDSHIEFKRKIDNARNILVGAVPSPAGQIDQITYALIYKFMSDIDDKSARLPGGTRQYFVGEYEKYDWHNLMRLDGQDKLNRYRDALSAMSKNEHLPEIFRSIYQNAFLPYNDPRTLNLFLKEVDGFVHTKSDAIGDAYEYLLSITGAQGDVGQFRTPRHIIKFIVDVVQPGKDDTVLDPACGTAGFLIAAYNYVRMQHDGVGEDGEQNGEQRLTADERKKLHGNYYGFDIDPTMVRTATVNMYLHGFSTPNIEIHDTLTSEEHWQNRYDVILANPPFMTPKGGIQPHGKFGVKANRAEVLFVDYIASHLKPNGRAGIIVPEGIIFQSGNAYKDLRKSLVENSLYAVVSLPSGVFNPYAGVKTSILLLDKDLAAKNDEILFVKIENDGYSLGAQRRKITGGQFPEALEVVERFKNGEELQTEFAHAVPRHQIAESGDYNLSGDRYKISDSPTLHDYPVVGLGDSDYFRIESGGTPSSKNEEFWNGDINWATLVDLPANDRITHVADTQRKITESGLKGSSAKLLPVGTILVSSRATIGRIGIAKVQLATNQGFKNIIVQNNKALPEYVANVMTTMTDTLKNLATGGTFAEFSKSALEKIKIPLPPIEIQREIVAELDGYQKIIDAAQTIIKTYKPTIKINPEWESARVGDVFKTGRGRVISKIDMSNNPGDYPVYSSQTTNNGEVGRIGTYDFDGEYITWTTDGANAGAVFYRKGRFNCTNVCGTAKPLGDYVDKVDLKYAARIIGTLTSPYVVRVGNPKLMNKEFERIVFPLPPIETQREIVAELEAEQQLINANKKLIEIYQQKIKSKIAEIWGE